MGNELLVVVEREGAGQVTEVRDLLQKSGERSSGISSSENELT